MRNGDTMLIMVKDGAVIHFTPNMSWPHVEFVRRTTGQLPEELGLEPFRNSMARLRQSVPSTSLVINCPVRTGSRQRCATSLSSSR